MNEKLKLSVSRWGLSEVETVYQNPNKAVFAAQSEQFGPVILKIDRDTAQLSSECDTLTRMLGCCRVWACDTHDGLLLEERILPGTPLREEPDMCKRIAAFKSAFRSIHSPAREGVTYLNWLEKINRFCERSDAAADIRDKAARALSICAEMFEKYPDRVLLHGDLHHDNLLRRGDGSYAVIDPKGVIGPEILDTPRFIMNELDTPYEEPEKEHMAKVIALVSRELDYPEEDIRRLYFMEVVLGNVWCLEDGEEMNGEELTLAAEMNQR